MRPEDRPCVTVVVGDWGPPAPSAKGWTYWVPAYVGELQVGDHVIVESPRDEKSKLVEKSGIPVLGKVSDAKPPLDIRKKATKWIVGRVDWDAYRALQDLLPTMKEDD